MNTENTKNEIMETSIKTTSEKNPEKNPEKPKKKKKKRSKRCYLCRKKVGMFGYTCKCGELFCAKHRYASEHSCTYDYRKEHKENLLKNNTDANFDKVLEI